MAEKKNYCTMFPDRIRDIDISGCCMVHDEDYENPTVKRRIADKWLRQ